MFSPSKMSLKKFFAHKNMRKPASKVAEPAQIQPKCQFLFHKNLPPRDFSLMTLALWCCLFTTKHRSMIRHNLGHSTVGILLPVKMSYSTFPNDQHYEF